jgi:cell division inhibitor SulA
MIQNIKTQPTKEAIYGSNPPNNPSTNQIVRPRIIEKLPGLSRWLPLLRQKRRLSHRQSRTSALWRQKVVKKTTSPIKNDPSFNAKVVFFLLTSLRAKRSNLVVFCGAGLLRWLTPSRNDVGFISVFLSTRSKILDYLS